MPDTPVKDKNYNLLTVLQQSLANNYQLEEYIADAQQDGDTELAEWLGRVQENNQKAGEQGKQLLVSRLQSEGS